MGAVTARSRWVRGLLLGVPLFVSAVAVAGVVYEQIAESVIAHKHHYRGGLYDVRGSKMHLDCVGQGQVTIVFDSGLGGYGSSWADVQEEVAKFGRSCSFDRAGYGWSDSGPLPRDSRADAA